ncbi:hypothetical protein GBA63_22500 (plasmid) [Rubrobacter tropicus]|uniref:Uncharacterized protein n=1 Tax=Rubrobacter tropicus TaxID=2653851 RepID=A0A6G8QG55_9ACTN|nr:hypothetical protein [Rubrobacter tropicus]QIN85475.1 hypothetical protein GBA63_22500 [Rubrobacter tropicus]
MLTCANSECPSNGPDDPGAGFERREYVRREILVDRADEPKDDEGIITDPLGAARTYRCLSCGGHDVHDR